jgi:hypothetical protein
MGSSRIVLALIGFATAFMLWTLVELWIRRRAGSAETHEPLLTTTTGVERAPETDSPIECAPQLSVGGKKKTAA